MIRALIGASMGVRGVALGSLMGGVAAMAVILWQGPGAAAGLIALLLGQDASDAAAESLFTLLIFGALLPVALAGGFVGGVRVWSPGTAPLTRGATGFALGLVGVGAGTGYAALSGTLSVAGTSYAGILTLWGAAVVLFQVWVEEVYFRGWLQPLMVRGFGAPVGIGVIALAFAALHYLGGASAALSFLNLLLGGLLFGVLAWRGGGIAGAVGAHFAWNASEQLVLGLDPNPGRSAFGSLFDLDLAGRSQWGGSIEGLNASLAMAMALVAVLIPILMLARARGARAHI